MSNTLNHNYYLKNMTIIKIYFSNVDFLLTVIKQTAYSS